MVLSVQSLVTTAVSSEPHAALAWAGALILMGPITRTVTQDVKAEDGFEDVTKVLARYKFREEKWPEIFSTNETSVELHSSIRNQTIDIYQKILEYQMRLTRHYLRSSLFRTVENLAWPEDWEVMHQAILNIDASVCRDLGEIGHGEMVHISGRMEEIFRDTKTSQNERARIREDILVCALPC